MSDRNCSPKPGIPDQVILHNLNVVCTTRPRNLILGYVQPITQNIYFKLIQLLRYIVLFQYTSAVVAPLFIL